METPRPWEQQPRETMRAFAAFTVYRDAGPQRSVHAMYAKPKGRAKGGKKRGLRKNTLEKWAKLYSWRERARAWDAEVDRLARERQLTALLEARERIVAASIQDQRALSIPMLEILERLDRKDKVAIEQLSAIPVEHLLRLAGYLMRAKTHAIKIELIARGVKAEMPVEEEASGTGVEVPDPVVETREVLRDLLPGMSDSEYAEFLKRAQQRVVDADVDTHAPV